MRGNIALHGRDAPLQQLRPVRAGDVTLVLDGIDVRYVKRGGTELVRRIYAAVRDRNWETIPAVPTRLEVEARPDSFTVTFEARHRSRDIDFTWEGLIDGTADGCIALRMRGHAERDLLYNRIGFCVLHPWRESAGRSFRGVTPNGPVSGTLPLLVGRQRFENGVYVPLFPAVSRLEIDADPGITVEFEFEGDLFETEDQRNWTDASFKTYSTPMALGFPHRLDRGARIAQSVVVSSRGTASRETPTATAHLEVKEEGDGARVPAVGLGLPAGAPEPSRAELALLRIVRPAHLRVDLHLADAGWQETLARAAATVGAIDSELELALFLRLEDEPALRSVRTALDRVRLARLLVCVEGAQTATAEESTPASLVRLVREHLSPAVPVAGGTDMDFCELNRTRPPVSEIDGIFWSMNAETHASDDVSLLETPEAQGEQVRCARDFAPGLATFAGPITFKPRYNSVATAEIVHDPHELPSSVDPRQASLLGAAWTLASLKHLAEARLDAATYFETVGWRGVIAGDEASPLPDRFSAVAGQTFPLAHVLADVTELQARRVASCETSHPLEVVGLALTDASATTLLVANLTSAERPVEIIGVAEPARIRRLNESTATEASLDPRHFRSSVAAIDPSHLILAPYETIRIDT